MNAPLTTSQAPLTHKQKEALAHQMVVKALGANYFRTTIPERAALRQAALDKINGHPGVPNEDKQELKPATVEPAVSEPNKTASLAEAPAPPEIHIPATVTVEPSDAFTTATAKAETLAPEPAPATSTIADVDGDGDSSKDTRHETFALDITLNSQQQLGADFAAAGKCFVFTGPAGTGKTTGCREIAKRLLDTGKLRTHDFKLRGGGRTWAPSIAFCAYTNRASNNMRRALHKDPILEEKLNVNIITVHRLLEYEPVFFTREDGSTGMRFEPMRNAGNKLHITHLVIEESSMLGIDLWLKLLDALKPGVQIIFVGDINQLPPVFSKSILNYALIGLPVVELTEVYRQALDSPIIANAHRCLRGEKLETVLPYFRVVSGKNLTKIPSESKCVNTLVNSLKKWLDERDEHGEVLYDPEQDIVLSPFNKNDAGTIAINNQIAQFLGQRRNAMVYEIFAGMRKLYLAVGDRVMVDKQDGYIKEIKHNARYIGKMPRPASTDLTRFGIRIIGSSGKREDEDFDDIMQGYENLDVSAIPDETDEKKPQEASHMVDIELDDGRMLTLNTSGDFSEAFFSLGYALTVHKAQGCEWRKVIIMMHRNHATLLSRELIYTAMTRAREYCIIVDLCNQLDKGIATQRIKGNTVQEKIEWFNSEVSLNEPVPIAP